MQALVKLCFVVGGGSFSKGHTKLPGRPPSSHSVRGMRGQIASMFRRGRPSSAKRIPRDAIQFGDQSDGSLRNIDTP